MTIRQLDEWTLIGGQIQYCFETMTAATPASIAMRNGSISSASSRSRERSMRISVPCES